MLQHNRKSAIENGRPEKKSRKCNSSYLDVGFTFILQNKKEKNSVRCLQQSFANESMLPNKLKRHLTSSFHHIRSLWINPGSFFSERKWSKEASAIYFTIHATPVKLHQHSTKLRTKLLSLKFSHRFWRTNAACCNRSCKYDVGSSCPKVRVGTAI